MQIALIGDYNPEKTAHIAIPKALNLISNLLKIEIDYTWLATNSINSKSDLEQFNGIWCVPGSPYLNMDGALLAIQYARENKIPFLGTCGGFQHAIVEYARNVLGIARAEHAETAPDAELQVITMLSCSLVEVSNSLTLTPNSKIAKAYASTEAIETYRCNYGINPSFEKKLTDNGIDVGARDNTNEIREIELVNHPFFIATLFQPERLALQNKIPPLVMAFIKSIDLL